MKYSMKIIDAHANRYMSIHQFFPALAALAVILLITIFGSTVASAGHTQAAQRESQTTYESIYIHGGDSLWSIAETYAATQDTGAFVTELKELNGLSSDRIVAGTYLLVPVENTL